MKIFLDANIIFSASKEDSVLCSFINYLLKNKHTLVSNDYARVEAERNIIAKNYGSDVGYKKIISKITFSNTMSNEQIANLADKDKPILLGAVAQQCDYLLTSDKKDFGPFMTRKIYRDNLLIGTPAMLAALLGLEK